MKLSKAEMAEVFELRVRGTSWENLGAIFHIAPSTLRRHYKIAMREGYMAWGKPMKSDKSDDYTILQIFDVLADFSFGFSELGVIVDDFTNSKYEWGEVQEARRKLNELINFAKSHGIKEGML